MTKSRFVEICMTAVAELKALSPIDTGNLRHNAIRYEWLSDTEFLIYVDESIAPYMPYTNEPWIAERWHGKKNPNEAWFQTAVEYLASKIASELNGELING